MVNQLVNDVLRDKILSSSTGGSHPLPVLVNPEQHWNELHSADARLALLRQIPHIEKIAKDSFPSKDDDRAFNFLASTSLPNTPEPLPKARRDALVAKIDQYITDRKSEWGFHYNFLMLVSLCYLVLDWATGSNHFNSKHSETKIAAAEKLKSAVAGSQVRYNPKELEAIDEGRLGKLIAVYRAIVITDQKVNELSEASTANTMRI